MSRNGLHWSESDLLKAQLKGARAMLTSQGQVKRSKYANQRVGFQGMVFDSQHELKQWKKLEQQRLLGAIRGVARQVSLQLPGTSRRVRIDFLVIDNSGAIRFLDAKGFQTDASRAKYQALSEGYGIEVQLC